MTLDYHVSHIVFQIGIISLP